MVPNNAHIDEDKNNNVQKMLEDNHLFKNLYFSLYFPCTIESKRLNDIIKRVPPTKK